MRSNGWGMVMSNSSYTETTEEFLERKSYENPFFSNHIFSKKDLNRAKLRLYWWQKIALWFHPTYVQINDGYEFHFKVSQTRYYLMKVKKFEFKAMEDL